MDHDGVQLLEPRMGVGLGIGLDPVDADVQVALYGAGDVGMVKGEDVGQRIVLEVLYVFGM